MSYGEQTTYYYQQDDGTSRMQHRQQRHQYSPMYQQQQQPQQPPIRGPPTLVSPWTAFFMLIALLIIVFNAVEVIIEKNKIAELDAIINKPALPPNVTEPIQDGGSITWDGTVFLDNHLVSLVVEQFPDLNKTAVFYIVKYDNRTNISNPEGIAYNVTGHLIYYDGVIWRDQGVFNGIKGRDGLSCWDKNQDFQCNITTEDTNNDGNCTVADCVSTGLFLVYCWDINNNTICDLSLEDINQDGFCNAHDCIGADGAVGLRCWDLNQDGACNLASEDINLDGTCSVTDCTGRNGTDGYHCWDLNQNRICDLTTEDKNMDAVCTTDDCDGINGINGANGINGQNGIDAYQCWDKNQNRLCDLASEDRNTDNQCTVLDCQGKDGTNGTGGLNGTVCWDLNSNGACDLVTEDKNSDGVCNITDCRGKDGLNGTSGTNGLNGTNGSDGSNANQCWDLNLNFACDLASEDKNSDLTCNQLDCDGINGRSFELDVIGELNDTTVATLTSTFSSYGKRNIFMYVTLDSRSNLTSPFNLPTNTTGTLITFSGTTWTYIGPFNLTTGPQGPTGPTGLSCWDKNANGVCDILSEDVTGDAVCDYKDCKGNDGTNGTNGKDGVNGTNCTPCWDLNLNGICDTATEDRNLDGVCNVTDCRGLNGANGQNGLNGTMCWDLDQNGICNLGTEDKNSDGQCTPLDCIGLTGANGTAGLSCWDLDKNGLCNLTSEDLDKNGVCDNYDCLMMASGPISVDNYAIQPVPGAGYASSVLATLGSSVWYIASYTIERPINCIGFYIKLGTATNTTLKFKILQGSDGQPYNAITKTSVQVASGNITITSANSNTFVFVPLDQGKTKISCCTFNLAWTDPAATRSTQYLVFSSPTLFKTGSFGDILPRLLGKLTTAATADFTSILASDVQSTSENSAIVLRLMGPDSQ